MKFNNMSIQTSRENDIMTTRLIFGPENPITIETPLDEELSIIKHVDSIKEILEEVVNKYLYK